MARVRGKAAKRARDRKVAGLRGICRTPRLQSFSAAITPSFLARSIRLLTEEGPQRVPPRGVRSYMASNCAPIWASFQFGIGAGDPRHQREQAFIAGISCDGRNNVGSASPVLDETSCRAAQFFDAPAGQGAGFGTASPGVENPRNILPAMIRPHLFDDRQPMLRRYC